MQRTSAPNIGLARLPQQARGFWNTWAAEAVDAIERFLERERAQLPPWIVVAFGLGIAAWFALPARTLWVGFICAAAAAGISGFFLVPGRLGRSLGWAGLAATAGCALIWARADWVAAPRLDRPQVVAFTATVERTEALVARGDVRLTLAPADPALPPRIRVSLKADDAPADLGRGAEIRLRARLTPPPPKVLPGMHDFARDSWFRGIGAVGRTLGPVEVLAPRPPSGLDALRERLGDHVRARLPGSAGGIAAALANGDQNGVGEADAEAMRRSGLTHLLSVSGLHIAAVVAAAMLLTLRLLALSETLALRFNLVLVGAGIGALAGVAYTLLTGSQVPTVRSCIAAILVLAGIALGREAMSLRLVAVGALAVLLVRPESLAGASFQLSFAAVTAIVVLHSSRWGGRLFARREEGMGSRFGRAFLGMVATGLAVELALIPLALFHFHRAGLYGVGANLVAIPLTTFIIMPLEALALFLDMFGLGAPLWQLTGVAVNGLLGLAHWVAAQPGAVATIAGMPGWALGAMIGGGLWLALWTGPQRLLGAYPLILGMVGASQAPTPDLLVTGDGRHVAIVRDGAVRLLRDRAGDFMRDSLAEAAGIDADPLPLAADPQAACSRDSCIAEVGTEGRRWRVMATRTSVRLPWEEIVAGCAAADIVISDRRLPRGCIPRWLKLDRPVLERSGGVAVHFGEQPVARTVAQEIGDHPWAM